MHLASMFLLSQKRHVGVPVLAVMLLAEWAGLYRFHGNVWQFIVVQAAAFGAASLVLLAFALPRRKRAPRP